MIKAIIRLLVVIQICNLMNCTNSPIDYTELVGEYNSEKDSEHFSSLFLRADSTYDFNQSMYYSCDLWIKTEGKCLIEDNILVLLPFIDIGSYIDIEILDDSKSDTLIIHLDSTLVNLIPDVKITNRIYPGELQMPFDNSIAKIYKPDYLTYQLEEFYVLMFNIRGGTYFGNTKNLYPYKEVKLKLRLPIEFQMEMPEKYVGYKIKGDYLTSVIFNDHPMYHRFVIDDKK